MSPFVAEHAGLIELTLVEGIVLAIAFRELWSVRSSQRRKPESDARDAAPAPPTSGPDGADHDGGAEGN